MTSITRIAGLLIVTVQAIVTACFAQDDLRDHALFPEEFIREQAVKAPLPTYPDAAMKDKITGVVLVMIEIDPDGAVTKIKVKPQTNRLLRDAVVDAVKEWLFKPYHRPDGTPGFILSRLAFEFRTGDEGGSVNLYDPRSTTPPDCLGCSDSMLEFRRWHDWEEVPLNKRNQ